MDLFTFYPRMIDNEICSFVLVWPLKTKPACMVAPSWIVNRHWKHGLKFGDNEFVNGAASYIARRIPLNRL